MSGPKKADVEAQLNIARRSQRRCAGLISSAEDAAIAGILREVNSILSEAGGLDEQLRSEAGSFDSDEQRIAPDAVRNATNAAEKCSAALNSLRDGLNRARGEVDRARQQENRANQTFENAEREFKRAEAALRNAGEHYMHDEMRWAQEATRLYEQAERELASAARTRKQTESAASDALRTARDAQGSLEGATQEVRNTRQEAQSLLRAEAEAKQIAEEKRRSATIVVEKAHSALGRVEGLQHQKFCPGAFDELQRELDAAVRNIESDRFDEAMSAGERITAAAGELEQQVVAAQQEFERKKAEAETQIGILEATLAGMDEDLIRDWSDHSGACGDARSVIERADQAVKEENFSEATTIARDTRQKLAEALKSAAEAKSAHERRAHIGDAIMEVLQELNFDVSFEPGSRDEPLRISGQTPDVEGKGDFDIAIPLSGEVDFEVAEPEGDISCISAVNSLQKRLAERGIKWETTDWGHAKGAVPTEMRKSQVPVKTGVKVKRPGEVRNRQLRHSK